MIISLIGESCTGKSTIAELIREKTGAETFTGKDYLKSAKNESDAKKKFKDLLSEKQDSPDHIVYVISEKEHLELLPEKTIKILLKAGLETIKGRFSKRMGGNMPIPVAAMLERKHGMFDDIYVDATFETDHSDPIEICERILHLKDE